MDASQGSAVHDTSLLVFSHTLFEEVGLALHGDHFHPWERVANVVDLGTVELHQKSVGHELNVLGHQIGVHADEVDGERPGDEFNFNVHGFRNDASNHVFTGSSEQFVVEQASEITVQAFVSGDQLVGERQPGHQSTLLQPEDGTERTGKEDAFNGGEGHETLGKGTPLLDNQRMAQSPFF